MRSPITSLGKVTIRDRFGATTYVCNFVCIMSTVLCNDFSGTYANKKRQPVKSALKLCLCIERIAVTHDALRMMMVSGTVEGSCVDAKTTKL